jgi:hypothetical protein
MYVIWINRYINTLIKIFFHAYTMAVGEDANHDKQEKNS